VLLAQTKCKNLIVATIGAANSGPLKVTKWSSKWCASSLARSVSRTKASPDSGAVAISDRAGEVRSFTHSMTLSLGGV
jgi:hypothetical protein